MGRRIIHWFGRQVDVAKALKLAQQTVSKKLRGECTVTISDLAKLARKIKQPIGVFFEPEEQAAEWECPEDGCPGRVVHTYTAIADVGNPICEHCDSEMDLVR
jgi:transcriptional regulator with XRE-family HTH domain